MRTSSRAENLDLKIRHLYELHIVDLVKSISMDEPILGQIAMGKTYSDNVKRDGSSQVFPRESIFSSFQVCYSCFES